GVAIAPRCYHTVTGLPGRAERALHLGDPLLVTLVERPLLDPLGADESGVRQDSQMLAGGRLADTELRRDEHAAHAVAHEIAVGLAREVRARRLEPAEDLSTYLLVGAWGGAGREGRRGGGAWAGGAGAMPRGGRGPGGGGTCA